MDILLYYYFFRVSRFSNIHVMHCLPDMVLMTSLVRIQISDIFFYPFFLTFLFPLFLFLLFLFTRSSIVMNLSWILFFSYVPTFGFIFSPTLFSVLFAGSFLMFLYSTFTYRLVSWFLLVALQFLDPFFLIFSVWFLFLYVSLDLSEVDDISIFSLNSFLLLI